MKSTEQTGRSVEDAVQAALKALGVSRDEVEIEVLSQENRGLLGILGTSRAKVRVTLKEGVEQPAAPAPEPSAPEAARGREPREPVEALPDDLEEIAPGNEAVPPPALAEASDLAVKARDLTNEILRLMAVSGRVEIVEEDAETVSINIREGSDLPLLIGKRGQNLSALQLLVATIVNRLLPLEERRRVLLDAGGYRERREEALVETAKRAAERAKRTGREVPLEPLNARERRIVHVALADDPGVSTRSEGEDPERYIVIVPKRRRGR